MCIRHAGVLSSIFVNCKDSEFDVHTLETLSYMHITMVTANVGAAGNCSWLLYSTTVLALIIGTGKTNCYYGRSIVIR